MSNRGLTSSELTKQRVDSNIAYFFNSIEVTDPGNRILSRRSAGVPSSELINLQSARTTMNLTLSSFQSIYNIQPSPAFYKKNFRPVENPAARTTYTSPAAATYTVPTTTNGFPVSGVNMYLWGGAGGFGNQPNGLGGGGGFVSGFYRCRGGTVLTYVLGSAGVNNLLGGGGGNSGATDVRGGGFSAFFNCTSTAAAAQSNVIAVAGGGGSGGQHAQGVGGGGGYPAGGNIVPYASNGNATGGSQSGPGVAPGGWGDGVGMLGGWGGGGGGYFGGGAAFRGAGGGGSSYIGGFSQNAYWENGQTSPTVSGIARPGGSGHPYYQGTHGLATNSSYTTGLIVVVPCYDEWDGTYS